MPNLIMYFNELCLEAQHPPSTHTWRESAKNLAVTLDALLSIRADCFIAVPQKGWIKGPENIRLNDEFKAALQPKEKYQRLLMRIRELPDLPVDLLHEVRFETKNTQALTLTELSQSWAVSLPIPDSAWLPNEIQAQHFRLNEQGQWHQPENIAVNHISQAPHIQEWEEKIRDWGWEISASSVLDELQGHRIVMYSAPLEHNPPHVHLLRPDSSSTFAKYRVDKFALEKGQDTYNREMKVWVEKFYPQLMTSWDRCQRGGHPYALVNPTEQL